MYSLSVKEINKIVNTELETMKLEMDNDVVSQGEYLAVLRFAYEITRRLFESKNKINK